MLWIGLTGGIASGKSTVTQILRQKGYFVVDADQIAHECLDQGSETYQKIVLEFGKTILDDQKKISRLKLGQLVFEDKNLLQKLENIVHPEVQKKVKQIKLDLEAKGNAFAFYDVPLLFEKKLQSQFDKIVVVYCTPQQQIERLMKRNNLTKQEAELRLKNQISIEEKKKLADFVIDNSNLLNDLSIQIDQLISKVMTK